MSRATRFATRCAMIASVFPSSIGFCQSPSLSPANSDATVAHSGGAHSGVSDSAVASEVVLASSIVSRIESKSNVAAVKRPGTLLLCGGNLLPRSILDVVYQRGRGAAGHLVIIPTASPRSDSGDYARWIQMWDDFRWSSITVVNAMDRESASDETFVQAIRNSTAIWIAGGEQVRLVERYLDTPVQKELLNALQRGAIVGGTSAGSAITSKTMIAEGGTQPVIKQGWGILPDAIVDQHFSQRNRFERLSRAVEQHTDKVGVGIDESTGILIDHRGVQVLGEGAVYVYEANDQPTDAVVHATRFESGSTLPAAAWNRMVIWQRK